MERRGRGERKSRRVLKRGFQLAIESSTGATNASIWGWVLLTRARMPLFMDGRMPPIHESMPPFMDAHLKGPRC